MKELYKLAVELMSALGQVDTVAEEITGANDENNEIFLGTWKGTVTVTKSNQPRLLPVGQTSPATLIISKKNNVLVVSNPTHLFGNGVPYKIITSGNTITVSYAGPDSKKIPNTVVTLNFTLTATVDGNKLAGTYASTTKSVVTVFEHSTESTFSIEATVNLTK